MTSEMIGRQAERDYLDRWLAAVPAGATALLIEGEAGIGKTTVLRAGLEAARRRFPVLSTSPTEAEARLSFAGLADLLDPVADRVLGELPAPQRQALEVALLRRGAAGRPPDPRTVGAAMLSSLRALAEDGPVVVAVDDVQWVDRATSRTLAFALRRLGRERIGALLARRGAPGDPAPLELDRAALFGGLHRLAVSGLRREIIRSLIRIHLGWMPSRPTLSRIHEVSGGNPLFALELARALQAHPEVAPGEPLPVPQRLGDLVRARLRRLPASAQEVLLHAAAMGQPAVSVLRQATGEDVGDALSLAAVAGLAARRGDRVTFGHPLFASVLYGSVPPTKRRTVHARLAEAVTDPEERTRHLGLSTTGPDAPIARALEEASSLARDRGAPDAAAELAELAGELTPPDCREAAWRRALLAGRYHADAQSAEAAQRLLKNVAHSDAPADVRADALFLLGHVEGATAGVHVGQARFREALDALGDGKTRRHARILTMLGHWTTAAMVHVDEGGDLLRRGLRLARRTRDRETEAQARLLLLFNRIIAGERLDRRGLEHTPGVDSGAMGLSFRGLVLTLVGDHQGARDWFKALRTRALDHGDELEYTIQTQQLSEVEWRDGNWERARELGEEAVAAAVAGGGQIYAPLAVGYLAVGHAAAGRLDEARALLDEWERIGEPSGYVPAVTYLSWARGFVELCAGAPERAVPPLERAWEISEQVGHRAHYTPFRADLVEALIAVGDLERAEHVLQVLEGRPSAFAALTGAWWPRCRALLAAARGDLDAALAAAERAAARLEHLPMPFEVARTRLVHGTVLRRARRKRAAREALEKAAEGFRRLGATLWQKRAEGELARVMVRPAPSFELTPTEERVARLVVDGRSNAEVAAALSLSVRTVEANLTRVYRKLGIERRSELIRLRSAAGDGGTSSRADR